MLDTDRKYRRRRADLIRLLWDKGIHHEPVLKAIGRVPRQEFMESCFEHRAYYDEALPIGLNQTISQPFTVAMQTALLDPRPGERILEIGTGSGYQAAVLCEMEAEVYSIERHEALLDRAREIFKNLGYRVHTQCSDGTLGWSAYAPFDGILVTAAAAQVPESLLEQLREPEADGAGGRLVIPVGGAEGQTMQRITRTGPDSYQTETFGQYRFVPLIGADGGQTE